jgi:hypothetical protein
MILHEVKYEDDNIHRVQRVEVRDINICNTSRKTSKSLVKYEGDLNQYDMG